MHTQSHHTQSTTFMSNPSKKGSINDLPPGIFKDWTEPKCQPSKQSSSQNAGPNYTNWKPELSEKSPPHTPPTNFPKASFVKVIKVLDHTVEIWSNEGALYKKESGPRTGRPIDAKKLAQLEETEKSSKKSFSTPIAPAWTHDI
ncbi:MAG: hypothetical protein WAZ18_07035 [Alphaproteobacteria bacterium]